MKRHLLFLSLFVTLQHLQAQTAQLSFDHLSEKEGLPTLGIHFIKQDNWGYIWIGTLDGLVRFDGYKPKIYRFASSLSYSPAVTIVIDGEQSIWVSSVYNGLLKYDRSNDRFVEYPYPKNVTEVILQTTDHEGNLWGYAFYHTMPRTLLVKFSKASNHFTFYDKYGSIVKSTGPDNTIWAATDKGLLKYDNKADKFVSAPGITDTSKDISRCYAPPSEPGVFWMNTLDNSSKQSLIVRLDTRSKTVKYFNKLNTPGLTAATSSINKIFEDKAHRLWFATQNGLLLFNRTNNIFANYLPADTDKKANKNEIYNIAEAKTGLLWLISGKGLLRFDPVKNLFKRVMADANRPDALSADSLNNVVIDQSGTLWTGGAVTGVDKINPGKSAFSFFHHTVRDGNIYHNGITNDAISAPDGYIYFTDGKGIYKWQPGQSRAFQVYQIGKTDTYIDALTVLKNDEIYFANGRGMKMLNPANHRVETYSPHGDDPTSVSSGKINVIIQDHTGLIWVGTEDSGVCSFDPSTHRFKRYPYIVNNTFEESGDKLDDQTIESLYEDREGVIWIGTATGGLNRFDRTTQKFKSYLFDGNRRVTSVGHIYEDTKRRFWVSSYSGGLQEFDRKTGHYTLYLDESRGLLTREANDIQEDKEGFLWVSTQAGLTRINPEDMSFKNYRLNDVLPGKSVMYDYNFLALNQQFALVMPNGFAVFNPRDLDDNPYPPQVHIEKIGYGNPASSIDSVTTRFRYGLTALTLPHNQNRITFTYIALHYTDPLQNKYAYQLQGYDNHWIQAGIQRSTTYTNLSPGTYTFHVKAANSDGVWNNKGDSFTIIINPPWWQTWWAWTFWIILFASALYAFVAYRSRKLQRDKKTLEHKVYMRTEEVMQQKEEIEAQRDELEHTLDVLKTTQTQLVQREKMASLGELTAGIAHEIQNPLNFVNNFSEVSTELLDEMDEELDKGDISEAKTIGADLKQNLEKIRQHGKRADSIVKAMMEHSRASTGEKQLTDLNVFCDEFMKLSYHGLRAKNKSFNAELTRHFDAELPKVNLSQQDMGRVLLNLFNNAFYAVNQKSKTAGPNYKPEVSVTTSVAGGNVMVTVKDNGDGIPENIKDKIMQPFFTTKPTGEGTGLGLSLSYDIVVKGHGGTIGVETTEGVYTEFKITLPLS